MNELRSPDTREAGAESSADGLLRDTTSTGGAMRHSPRITHICWGQKSLHSLGPLFPAIGKRWLALASHDPGVAVHNGACKAIRRVLDAEGVGSTASAFACPASLVFPVFAAQKRNVNPPDNHRPPRLYD